MTIGEIKRFLAHEQNCRVSDAECKQIVDEFEPSLARRKRGRLSAEGFCRFFMFSDLHDLMDYAKTDNVYQVSYTGFAQGGGYCFAIF